MGNNVADEESEAKEHGWKALLSGLAGGGALIWFGVDILRAPSECRGGRKLMGELTNWLCHNIGSVGTGVLHVILGVVVLFAALLWSRHAT